MKKKLLAMLFISLLTLSACSPGEVDPIPPKTTEPPQITTEAPEATTVPPEVTTAEPRPYTAFAANRDGGYFESDGEYIYFIHPETFGLYRLRGDMTEPQCLHDMTCTSLFLDGDTLYFIGKMAYSEYANHYYLYAMDTDGQNKRRLGSIGSDRYRILSVTDDRVHVMSPSDYTTLSYDKATGLHKQCIPEITGYDHWLFHDGMLYFTSHGAHEYQLPAGLYRMQDDFKAREKLTDREALYTLAAEDNLLFTTAMGELWSIQPDGSGETRLADGIYGPLALSGNTLFHTDRQGRLCSLNLTTGISAVLPEQRPADRLEAIGDTVFLIRDQSTPTTTMYDIRELEYARMHTDGTGLLSYTPPTVEPVETIIPIPDTVHGQGGRSVADGDTVYALSPSDALIVYENGFSAPKVLDDRVCTTPLLDRDHVYYGAEGNLYRLNRHTGETELFLAEAEPLALTDSRIFMEYLDAIYSIGKDGSLLTQRTTFLGVQYVAGDGVLFFIVAGSSQEDDPETIYRLDLRGGEPEKAAEAQSLWMAADGDTLYYSEGTGVYMVRDRITTCILPGNYPRGSVQNGTVYAADAESSLIAWQNGTQTPLVTGSRVTRVEAAGDYLFYTTRTPGADGRTVQYQDMVRLSGGQPMVLRTYEPQPISLPDTISSQGRSFVTDGQHIYYSHQGIWRANMDFSDPVLLDEGTGEKLFLDSRHLYFSSYDTGITRIDLQTGQKESLSPGGSLLGMTGELLLVSDRGLCTLRKDGGGKDRLRTRNWDTTGYTLCGDSIYFYDNSDSWNTIGLYRCPLWGGPVEKLTDGDVMDMVPVGDTLYFTHHAPIPWFDEYGEPPIVPCTLYRVGPGQSPEEVYTIDGEITLHGLDETYYYTTEAPFYTKQTDFPLTRVNRQTLEREVIYVDHKTNDSRIWHYELVGDYLCFSDALDGEEKSLCRIRTDGSDFTVFDKN